ncbi:MAG: PKD domain-containing protein, partial [Caldilineaceae bacterium]
MSLALARRLAPGRAAVPPTPPPLHAALVRDDRLSTPGHQGDTMKRSALLISAVIVFSALCALGIAGTVAAASLAEEPPVSPLNNNFADAQDITTLPFGSGLDWLSSADLEVDEPQPGCGWTEVGATVWYKHTPIDSLDRQVNLQNYDYTYDLQAAVYVEDESGLHQVSCSHAMAWYESTVDYLSVTPGTTYYVQVGANGWPSPAPATAPFWIDVAPDPVVHGIGVDQWPPMGTLVNYQFRAWASGNIGRWTWDFDGELDPNATSDVVYHRFNSDGEHYVTVTVEAADGRTASYTQFVWVSTPPVEPHIWYSVNPNRLNPTEFSGWEPYGDYGGFIDRWVWDFG